MLEEKEDSKCIDTICSVQLEYSQRVHKAGRKLLCGGGGWYGSPFAQRPPPPPWSPCREGGLGWGWATYRAKGGGGTPTYMAQNDPHVALIILTTHMWGKNFLRKKNLWAKICVPAPLVASFVLTQNKGPGTEAHFWNLPPPPSPGAHAIPPPAKQFSGRLMGTLSTTQTHNTTQLQRGLVRQNSKVAAHY